MMRYMHQEFVMKLKLIPFICSRYFRRLRGYGDKRLAAPDRNMKTTADNPPYTMTILPPVEGRCGKNV